MANKMMIAIALSALALGAGCGRSSTPPPEPDPPPPPDPEPSVSQAADDGSRIRISLKPDGSVARIEGRQSPPADAPVGSPVGDWQTFLTDEQSPPKSPSEPLATIQVYGLTPEENDDMNNPDDKDQHPHAGVVDPASPPHCHQWIYVGTKRYLVHC
jgi:hypothetical protein